MPMLGLHVILHMIFLKTSSVGFYEVLIGLEGPSSCEIWHHYGCDINGTGQELGKSIEIGCPSFEVPRLSFYQHVALTNGEL